MSKEVNGFVLDDVGPADEDARRTLCIKGYKALGPRTDALKRKMADITSNKTITTPFYERKYIVNKDEGKEVTKNVFPKAVSSRSDQRSDRRLTARHKRRAAVSNGHAPGVHCIAGGRQPTSACGKREHHL
jgi:hypothetical protein